MTEERVNEKVKIQFERTGRKKDSVVRGHQDRCMIRSEVSDCLKNGQQTRYQDVVLSHQRPRDVLGGCFYSDYNHLKVSQVFSLGRSPRLCLQLAERDKYQGRLGRSAVSMDVVAPQIIPLLSAMALIKLRFFLSPCLPAPLHCCVTGVCEAVVAGGEVNSVGKSRRTPVSPCWSFDLVVTGHGASTQNFANLLRESCWGGKMSG